MINDFDDNAEEKVGKEKGGESKNGISTPYAIIHMNAKTEYSRKFFCFLRSRNLCHKLERLSLKIRIL